MVDIPFLFTRFYTSKRWLFGISEPSTVCFMFMSQICEYVFGLTNYQFLFLDGVKHVVMEMHKPMIWWSPLVFRIFNPASSPTMKEAWTINCLPVIQHSNGEWTIFQCISCWKTMMFNCHVCLLIEGKSGVVSPGIFN